MPLCRIQNDRFLFMHDLLLSSLNMSSLCFCLCLTPFRSLSQRTRRIAPVLCSNRLKSRQQNRTPLQIRIVKHAISIKWNECKSIQSHRSDIIIFYHRHTSIRFMDGCCRPFCSTNDNKKNRKRQQRFVAWFRLMNSIKMRAKYFNREYWDANSDQIISTYNIFRLWFGSVHFRFTQKRHKMHGKMNSIWEAPATNKNIMNLIKHQKLNARTSILQMTINKSQKKSGTSRRMGAQAREVNNGICNNNVWRHFESRFLMRK